MVVLVCPLDWGLGHAMRCIPIIDGLIKEGHEVICCGDGLSGEVLRREYPRLKHVHLSGYDVSYSSKESQLLKLLSQFPKMIRSVVSEHRDIQKIAARYGADMIISDNRYGLFCRGIKSIFITHQVNVKTPSRAVSLVVNVINHWFIRRYDECWVPDVEGDDNLSGELSHGGMFVNSGIDGKWLKYIGFLSRFKKSDAESDNGEVILGVISGIEPQRTIFAEELIKKLKLDGRKAEIVLGLPSSSQAEVIIDGNLTIYPYLNGAELSRRIAAASFVICRSGYSILMDMQVFGKSLVVVPTPGQTEQEYLADYLEVRGKVKKVKQSDIVSLEL